MNTFTRPLVIAAALLGGFASSCAGSDQPSEFDEAAIRSMQDARDMPQAFPSAVEAFESSSDPTVKATKWEELIVITSESILSANWTIPAGGWKLIEFPTGSNITLQGAQDQQRNKAYYTKLVAQNETNAMRLRGAGALMLDAASSGEQWAGTLLLDIAQRSDSNIKLLTYWSTRDFGQDANAIAWTVDWNAWQQAYNAADSLGKAIILRNITMLAVRKNEFPVAAAINLSALSGTDRALKAIALAFGDPAFGASVTAKWTEIASDASDPQLQALAQEVRRKFGLE
ncbi:hypothetical protein DES53_102108 [Roseimicrobium gellanilyticum]|uniref:Lipoprotein n=1 Tax=Roseimicrobium gellanilyticum TaxID=748857 RepID=A0A366HQG6_9BACT|nr:hypothetical protein [Roseimicrobium gellanilyticum]RBP45726.1 hypothetical protein DES53_102108 [Roseimicrobium gellanilyticum]